MKSCEIIRKESGLFTLRHYYGYPQRMISDIELSTSVDTAKQMATDWMSRISLDDLPEGKRQSLIDSISDSAPIEKQGGEIVTDNTDRRRMMIDSPNYPVLSSNLIRNKY